MAGSLMAAFKTFSDIKDKEMQREREKKLGYVSAMVQMLGPKAAFREPTVIENFTSVYGIEPKHFEASIVDKYFRDVSVEDLVKKGGYSQEGAEAELSRIETLRAGVEARFAPSLEQQQAGILQQVDPESASDREIMLGLGGAQESALELQALKGVTSQKPIEQIEAEAAAKARGQAVVTEQFADKKTKRTLSLFTKKEAIKSEYRTKESVDLFERQRFADARDFFQDQYGLTPDVAQNVSLSVVTGSAISPKMLQNHPRKDEIELEMEQQRINISQERLDLEKQGALNRAEKFAIAGLRSLATPSEVAQYINLAGINRYTQDRSSELQSLYAIKSVIADKLVSLAVKGKDFPKGILTGHAQLKSIKEDFERIKEEAIFAEIQKLKEAALAETETSLLKVQ